MGGTFGSFFGGALMENLLNRYCGMKEGKLSNGWSDWGDMVFMLVVSRS